MKKIILISAIILMASAGIAGAQIGMPNFWYPTEEGYLMPVSDEWGLRIGTSTLASCGKIYTNASGTLVCGTDAEGSGATTTINGVSGPTFTFATSTSGFTISTSTGTITFGFTESDPIWQASSTDYYTTDEIDDFEFITEGDVPANEEDPLWAASSTEYAKIDFSNLITFTEVVQFNASVGGNSATLIFDPSGNLTFTAEGGDISFQQVGEVYKFRAGIGGTLGILDFNEVIDTDKTFTFPNASGTLALGTSTANNLAYWSDTNTLTGFASGTAGYVLTATGTAPYFEWKAQSGGGDLLAANNLSDLASTSTGRTNLGLGTANSPSFVGVNVGNTGLHVADTDDSHDLVIQPLSDLTLQRTLGISTGDSDRTITLSGNPTLADWFSQAVKTTSSPTFAGLTLTGLTGVLRADAGVVSTTTAGSGDMTKAVYDIDDDGEVTETESNQTWTLHDDYPAGCYGGQLVSAIGDTLTCVTETDPLWVASSTNFANWNTAYDDRLKWDGGATGLVAATGRTSLGLGDSATLASSTWVKTESDPIWNAASSSFVKWADSTTTNWNTAYSNYGQWSGTSTGLTAATGRTSLGLGTGDSPTFTGLTLSGLKSGLLTINGSGVISTSTVGISNMASTDFGGFTCNGSTCGIDSDATWTGHNSYPSDCTSNGVVYGLGDTLSCYSTSTLRTNLALVVGTNVQAYDANIATTGVATLSSLISIGTITTGVWHGTAIEAGYYGAATIDGDDINSNLAGRSLTLTAASPDTLDLDAEIYSRTLSINLISATNTLEAMFKKQTAITITKVSCNSVNGTTTLNLLERTEASPNSAGTAVLSASLVCGVSGTASSSAFGNAGIAANAPVAASTTAVTGTSVNTYIFVDYTIDD